MRQALRTATVAAALIAASAAPAFAQNAFIGEVRAFANTFCPTGFAEANGQIMSVTDHPDLFNLYGRLYGGDGVTTFALPNLVGHAMQGGYTSSGRAPQLGKVYGTETTTQAIAHTHALMASKANPTENEPVGAGIPSHERLMPFKTNTGRDVDSTMNSDVIASAGNEAGVENRQPFLVVRYCVALKGVYPPKP